jgi:hypothetical protein
MPALTDFQLEVTRLFFSLPASKGFLLAGGAALLAQHLTTRPTEDLDCFTAPDRGHVPAARDALEAAARKRGWTTERIHDSDTFCRFVIRSDTAEIVTDLAVDTPPGFLPLPPLPGPHWLPRNSPSLGGWLLQAGSWRWILRRAVGEQPARAAAVRWAQLARRSPGNWWHQPDLRIGLDGMSRAAGLAAAVPPRARAG